MRQIDRLPKLRRMFDAQRCVTQSHAMRELETSRATLYRDIATLRHEHGMPITWVPERKGWLLARPPVVSIANGARNTANQTGTASAAYELPGLWFTPQEIHALLAMQHLLGEIGLGGLLVDKLQPLRKRLQALITSGMPSDIDNMARYVRVAAVAIRPVHLPHFQTIGHALLHRKRIAITHLARARNQTTQRDVSPQRLMHYRGNWYLDAWCHQREALRSFAIDAIQSARALTTTAVDMDEAQLDEALGAGYGIFAGSTVQWARLRFSPERAKWVAAETWHPDQRGEWDAQGRWVLDLPYANPTELVMDVLRHVPHVQVLAPPELLQMVEEKLGLGIRTVRVGSSGETGVDEDCSSD